MNAKSRRHFDKAFLSGTSLGTFSKTRLAANLDSFTNLLFDIEIPGWRSLSLRRMSRPLAEDVDQECQAFNTVTPAPGIYWPWIAMAGFKIRLAGGSAQVPSPA